MSKQVIIDIIFSPPQKVGRERIYHTNYRPAFENKKGEFFQES